MITDTWRGDPLKAPCRHSQYFNDEIFGEEFSLEMEGSLVEKNKVVAVGIGIPPESGHLYVFA